MTKSSDSELEKRLRSLTETLIKKQTTIEALSSDKSSLTLELERYKRNQVCNGIKLWIHGPIRCPNSLTPTVRPFYPIFSRQ